MRSTNGLTEVVRGSLTGSVVGNILLVLGFSLFFGRGDPSVDRESSFIWLGLILVADARCSSCLRFPAGTATRSATRSRCSRSRSSIVLLVLYVVVTWWQLRRHARQHEAPESSEGVWSLRASIAVLGVATVADGA